MGDQANVVVKKLAAALSLKRNESYAKVITWLRCRLAFSLSRSAVRCVCVCVCGSRTMRKRQQVVSNSLPTALVLTECRVPGSLVLWVWVRVCVLSMVLILPLALTLTLTMYRAVSTVYL
jgi:hypothetical protein